MLISNEALACFDPGLIGTPKDVDKYEAFFRGFDLGLEGIFKDVQEMLMKMVVTLIAIDDA